MSKSYASAKMNNADYDPRKRVKCKLKRDSETDYYCWVFENKFGDEIAFKQIGEHRNEFLKIKDAQTAFNKAFKNDGLKHNWSYKKFAG